MGVVWKVCVVCRKRKRIGQTKRACKSCRLRRSRQAPPMTGSASTYAERDMMLRRMGYSSYPKYLASALWRRIRRRVFVERGRKCELCDEKADVVHHVVYDAPTLRGEDITRLVVLCDGCHDSVEVDSCGRKRTLADAHSFFMGLWGSRYLPDLPPAPSPDSLPPGLRRLFS